VFEKEKKMKKQFFYVLLTTLMLLFMGQTYAQGPGDPEMGPNDGMGGCPLEQEQCECIEAACPHDEGNPPDHECFKTVAEDCGVPADMMDMGPGPDGDMGPGPDGDMGPGPDGDMGPGPDGDMGPGPNDDMGPGPHDDMGPGPNGDMGPGPNGDMGPGPHDDMGAPIEACFQENPGDKEQCCPPGDDVCMNTDW
jgi:hypothetical protein